MKVSTLARRVRTVKSLFGLLVGEIEQQRGLLRELRAKLDGNEHDADRELAQLAGDGWPE